MCIKNDKLKQCKQNYKIEQGINYKFRYGNNNKKNEQYTKFIISFFKNLLGHLNNFPKWD